MILISIDKYINNFMTFDKIPADKSHAPPLNLSCQFQDPCLLDLNRYYDISDSTFLANFRGTSLNFLFDKNK